ncbi:MAG TPA: S49 family peptidase, partial [Actinomycetota bacterium]|nr:S49 family peptidase [Actinomycetota bacterium]
GVIMVLLNLESAAGKLGIEPIVIKAGRFKDIGSPFRDISRRERAILQGLIDEAYERFLSVVEQGRDVPEDELREVADGRLLSGAQAEDAGLVDELGDFDRAVEEARELADIEQARVVEYEAPFSLFGALGDGFPSIGDPVEQLEGSIGVTGPVLKYLYVS